MPHRNRVDPFGRMIETPARGAWYGNRGCLHDRTGRITGRKPPTDAWIICLLEFNGRRRTPLLQPGRFTELFFLDEATGFAAGHRPCGECRHRDLRRFGAFWPGAFEEKRTAFVPEIDAVMRRGRVDGNDPKRLLWIDPESPPVDGLLFVRADGPDESLLAARGRLWRWTPFGYEGPVRWDAREKVRLLTPPSSAAAIANGYRVHIHPSALR